MAVWSSVNLSEFYGAFRWDPECYKPSVLKDQHALARFNTIKLGDIALVTDGQHGYHEVDEASDIRHLTAKCVGPGVVFDKDADRLSLATHQANPESQLESDDILLSTAGTIGEAGIVTRELLPANIDQDVARIKVHPNGPFHPYFLTAFLRSEYGGFQSARATTGQIQGHINLTALRQFDIPIVPNQSVIVNLMRRGIEDFHRSHALIASAETTLTCAIGLDRIGSTTSKCYSRSLNEMLESRRFDAEFFSPRFLQIMRHLSRSGITIGDVAPMADRRFKAQRGTKFRYIEIGDMIGNGEAADTFIDGEHAPSRATQIVRSGDIITSTVRPIRRLSAIVLPEQDGAVCSSGFAVLSPQKVEPEVLLTYLRLPTICELLDLHTTATMYPAIPVDRLVKIPFCIPTAQCRKKIVELVRGGIKAHRNAMTALAKAKDEVELQIGSAV
jgi:hypothetical protein